MGSINKTFTKYGTTAVFYADGHGDVSDRLVRDGSVGAPVCGVQQPLRQ